MGDRNETSTMAHKERIRREIEAQVQEYLNRGGRINEIGCSQRSGVKAIGETWALPFGEGLPGS